MSTRSDDIRATTAAQHTAALENIRALTSTNIRGARLRAAGGVSPSFAAGVNALRAAEMARLRDLEEPEDIPTAYRAAIENRAPIQSDLDPTMWPGYDPFGQPANGQAMAIAFRKLQQADAAPVVVAAAARPEPTILRDGIPSGWDTAIARMKENRR